MPAMITVKQTSRLIGWAIAALIVLGVLLHFFGPTELETDELIVIALLILVLIVFRFWLRRSEWQSWRLGNQRTMAARRFPPPWSVEELETCFVVRDHNGQALAYVCYENENGRRLNGSDHHQFALE
jgi:hypothetical protein